MLLSMSGTDVSTAAYTAAHQSAASGSKPPPSKAAVTAAQTYTGQAVKGAQATPADGNKAVLAMAAELRLTYQEDSSNTQATRAAADALAARYGGGAQVKKWSESALQMVLNETPAERATNSDLAKVDQAGANLTQVEGQNSAGHASSAQVATAKANYLAA